MDQKRTVIIPFKNEGQEVYNTVKNIRDNSDQEIDIILINDASEDGYDYQRVAQEFQTKYIEHRLSIGVAASRDHGVEVCKTPYFMFLDGHMRIFTPNWVSIILEELQKNQRAVFCCQTVSINKEGKQIEEGGKGFGAHINLSDLSYNWNSEDTSTGTTVTDIPCVMGASYASNVLYWKKLHGLEGLRSYGYDEQLISMKTILEGGTCKLIKTVTFGHIFRVLEEVPYKIQKADYIFNQLYLIELLYPQDCKIVYFRWLKSHCEEDCFEQALAKMQKLRSHIFEAKAYYKMIFTRDFDYLKQLNAAFLDENQPFIW